MARPVGLVERRPDFLGINLQAGEGLGAKDRRCVHTYILAAAQEVDFKVAREGEAAWGNSQSRQGRAAPPAAGVPNNTTLARKQ